MNYSYQDPGFFKTSIRQIVPATILALTAVLLSSPPSRAADLQAVRANAPEIIKCLQPTNRLDASKTLKLAIGLPLRNQEELDALLGQLYDPASPNFHQYLTPDQFTQKFGPSEADYLAARAFAESNGLTVIRTHPNRLLLDVSGPVAAVEKAFHVNLNVYNHPSGTRTFYAPDAEPSINAAVRILDVAGLDDYVIPHPKLIRYGAVDENARVASKNGSGPGGLFMGSDFRNAYAPGVTLTGTGQTVGLLEFDTYYASDIAKYETKTSLPAVPLENVAIDGFTGPPGGGNVEVALDIEMAISMAPGLDKVIVYEEDYTGSASINNDMLNRIATDNQAKQIGCSWDFSLNSTSEQIFKEYAAQGQSFYDASGDVDAYVGGVPQPDDDPYITIVGGTELTMKGTGASWSAESVWNDNEGDGSSGGISTSYPIPSWQRGISMSASRGSTTFRNIPDVAMVADNILVVADNGVTESVGGTSCAAPLWAGFTALVNEQAVSNGLPVIGFINPAVYALGKSSHYATNFHDIKTGNNESPDSPGLFSAVIGYDLCTGWGTPIGSNLITGLLTPIPPPPPAPTNLVATAGNQQVTLGWSPVAGATSYHVKIALISGGAYTTIGNPTNTNFTSATLTDGTTYYYVVSAVNANGESTNSTQVSAVPTSAVILTGVTVQPRLNSAIITWNTGTAATAQIFYGTDTNYGGVSGLNAGLSTSQSVLLTGLLPDTLYYFDAASTAGTNQGSVTGTFFTDPSVILTADTAAYAGVWFTDTSAPDKYSVSYRYANTVPQTLDTSEALFAPVITTPADYNVYMWYGSGASRSANVPVTISSDNGVTRVYVDQTSGAGGWQLALADEPFGAQPGATVTIGNGTGETGRVVIADAVMLAYNPAQDRPTDGSVPDWWATYYYGSPLSGSLPGANGYSLFASYIMGLTPTNANSTLSLGVVPQSGGFSVIFSPFLNGRDYQLVGSPSLTSPTWTAVPNTTLTQNSGGRGVINIPAIGGTQVFYRISVQLSP